MNATTTDAVPAIELRGVTQRFRTPSGGVYTALRDLDMTVAPGEFCAVVGPTGCGKSTTLSLISGLKAASAGRTLLHGEPVTSLDRRVGFMFQTDAAFPWRTVLDNVAAGPRFRGVPRRDAVAAARDWLRRVGLSGFEDRLPHQLSGGMRKRVALAQTLINEPEILLMDEPFSALDVQTRQIVQDELLGLWELTRPAVVFVTHDLEEAIALADKVVVLTVGPGTVKDTFAIDLPRPRRVQEIRFDARFVALYERIWTSLRDEVRLAYARTAGVDKGAGAMDAAATPADAAATPADAPAPATSLPQAPTPSDDAEVH
ncbi:ABC transporter ATP-binding protein [Streptomyces sp. ICBB 8177]|uniref:ABC transporter ATP-binding protein n=1 Tax=Streptomyces sp. ICBB 8177 TaxID=563922 RepID=UPI000D67E254|nr:ABC transporter ATP-binding protein [Streptomyces sp. ICBB 8177]PWI45209.1 mannosyltransferase [Streptomyces sp. ICBB 8177]